MIIVETVKIVIIKEKDKKYIHICFILDNSVKDSLFLTFVYKENLFFALNGTACCLLYPVVR